ncbi:MAG: hypothetical protein JHC87_03015, partial [Thermoleophilaceae bacterium]|nr:hypothetical protein [Thermoleophilaceae bacterium]
MEDQDNDDQLQKAMLGATPSSHKPGGRGGLERDPRGSQPPQDLDVAPVRTDDELIGRPKQASALVRTIVFSLSFLFVFSILAMTVYIEVVYGIDPLGLMTLIVFGLVFYGLVNAVR